MGTRKTRLIVTMSLLFMSIIGIIVGSIIKDSAIIITSLSLAHGTGITYITGKTWNNNVQMKNTKTQ